MNCHAGAGGPAAGRRSPGVEPPRRGTGNCASSSDKDRLDGVPGWWFYLNFTAQQVPWVE